MALGALLGACHEAPASLDFEKHGMVTGLQWFGLDNLSVVRVDPAGRPVELIWRGYDKLKDSHHPPWEELELSCGSERFLVSSRCGNNQLIVNGRCLELPARERGLWVTFGTDVETGPVIPYEDSVRSDEY